MGVRGWLKEAHNKPFMSRQRQSYAFSPPLLILVLSFKVAFDFERVLVVFVGFIKGSCCREIRANSL
jgi:hypothetical protein